MKTTLNTPPQFAVIDGKEYTAWNMLDGNVMTGQLVQDWGDAFIVVRPDGTSCRVPVGMCRPATVEDILSAVAFFSRIGR